MTDVQNEALQNALIRSSKIIEDSIESWRRISRDYSEDDDQHWSYKAEADRLENHLLRAAAVNEDFYAKVIHAEEIIKTADTARARAEQKLSMYVSDMQNFAAFAHWLELRFNGVFKFSEIGRNWGARQRKLEHLAELVKRDSTDPVVVRLATEALEILDDITLPQRNAKE